MKTKEQTCKYNTNRDSNWAEAYCTFRIPCKLPSHLKIVSVGYPKCRYCECYEKVENDN